ncbi:glycosyltransferase family 2 protein [Bartonella sp. LJL80]
MIESFRFWFFTVTFAIVFTFYSLWVLIMLVQLALALYAYLKRASIPKNGLLWHRYFETAPPISIIVPAYNEEKTIVQSVYSLVSLDYPAFEVIIVNDGSKDDMLSVLIAEFDLQPIARECETILPYNEIRGIYGSKRYARLIVVDKENGGKADAQNAGISVSRMALLCMVDADTILEPDGLLRMVQPFIDDPARTVAVGGSVMIANGSKVSAGRLTRVAIRFNFLIYFQILEYLRAFLMARVAWGYVNTLTLISGAFGMFSRREVMAVGGYTKGSVGEDFDLVIKIHRHMLENKRDYRISFVPDAVCWTEAPEDFSVLAKQRTRWQRGALEVYFRHQDVMFNRRYGRIGFVGMPMVFIIDVISPILELFSYILFPIVYYFKAMTFEFLLSFVFMLFMYGIFISLLAISLEQVHLGFLRRAKYILLLFLSSVIECFGYRQINTFWRIKAAWEYFSGNTAWGEIKRTGFDSKKKPTEK